MTRTKTAIKTAAKAPRFTCRGSVRGDCGVAHRSEQAAEACIARDHSGCRSQGGYSDRYVRVISA